MGLINCPECGRQNVSEFAEACPSCGFSIKQNLKLHNEKRRFISLGTVTIKVDDITSFELKNASNDFLYPIEKLEAIINSKKEEVSELRYRADAAWDKALRTQSFGYADEMEAANDVANEIEDEITYYQHKYENLVKKINHFSKKYELAKANKLFVLKIKTIYDNFKYYNASAPFDIEKKYEELVEIIN